MQKYVSLVDLVKSFLTSMYLQKSASIQPRTSLSKFENYPIHFFNSLLSQGSKLFRPSFLEQCGRTIDQNLSDGALEESVFLRFFLICVATSEENTRIIDDCCNAWKKTRSKIAADTR